MRGRLVRIAELEAALQERWDRETLAVYGDALQAEGDPRGELIALDLHLERHGVTRDYYASWQQAMAAWLGDAWTKSKISPWPPKSFRFGFLDDLRIQPTGSLRSADVCRMVLRTPAAAFLRGATITDDARGIRESLDALAGDVRPWLDRLTIVQDTPRAAAPIALAGILGAAAPRLREVAVRGHRAAAAPLPGSVRRLVIDGGTALDVVDAGSSNVIEVDLRLSSAEPRVIAGLAKRLAPARFPLLSRLDFSRCQHSPVVFYGQNDPLRLVMVLEAPERIRSLRIAPPYRADQQQMLEAIRMRLPELAIELAAER